jgi:hypothetical protein
MTYSMDALRAKVKEMFPDIDKYQMDCDITFDEGKNAYIIRLTKGEEHVLTTYLDKPDADACMEGKECVHLGVQVAQFVKNFEEREGIK